MKYFIDTEFLEGTQDKTIFGIKYRKTKPTIDLMSIGIVAEEVKGFVYKNDKPKFYGYEGVLNKVKQSSDYPKQINEHYALANSRQDKELYNFFDFY